MHKAVKKVFDWLRDPRRGRTGDRPAAPASAPAPRVLHPEPPAIYARLGIPATLHYPTTTLGQMFDDTAHRFADAPVMQFNGTTVTYGQMRATVDRLAGAMAKLGVRCGDRVIVTLPNCPQYVYCFFAIQKLGAVLVNAGPLMGVDDLRKLIEKTAPKLAVGVDLQAPALCAAGRGTTTPAVMWVSLKEYQPILRRLGYQWKLWKSDASACANAIQVQFDKALADAPPKPPTVAPHYDDVALLQPTGGTTGTLKVAELTHRNILANCEQLSVWVPMRPGQERILGVLPMFHVYGMTTCLTTAIFNAACIYPLMRFRVGQVLDTIEQRRPTIVPLVPAIIQAICDELEQRPRPGVIEAVRNRYVISGAAPLPPATADRFEQLTGLRIVQGYGLTECSPVTHANPPQEPRGGSIGIPLPDTHTRIVDLDNPSKDAEPGQPGELWISGPQVMRGYFAEPEQTANVFAHDDDGRRWLRTGDVARVDEDGYFYILDRRKDMINRGGLKVYPAKVERVIMMHSAVADAGVIGESDDKYTETVVAKIALRPPHKATHGVRDEVLALCREHLAPYEVPMRLDFVDEVPRSALGKMLKHRMRDAAAGPAPRPAESAVADPPTDPER